MLFASLLVAPMAPLQDEADRCERAGRFEGGLLFSVTGLFFHLSHEESYLFPGAQEVGGLDLVGGCLVLEALDVPIEQVAFGGEVEGLAGRLALPAGLGVGGAVLAEGLIQGGGECRFRGFCPRDFQ